jgi:hypothetical protein
MFDSPSPSAAKVREKERSETEAQRKDVTEYSILLCVAPRSL